MNKGNQIDKEVTHEYQIDIGSIFSKVYETWREYNRQFLEKDFHDALMIILDKLKCFEARYCEDQIHYFKRIQEVDYENALEKSTHLDSFPFPDFYLRYNTPTDAYPSVISFHTPYTLEKGELFFDLFFAMKITTVDLMKVDDFFKFHFRTSFNKNKNTYLDFLSKLLLKYDKLLTEKYSIAITSFMNTLKNKLQNNDIKQEVPSSITKELTKKEAIKAVQVKWQGNNETEFVQLIYALYEAGYIKNESDSIINMVKQFAENFDFKLGKNWPSNLSKSINERNHDYHPEIFEKLEEGFNKYRQKIIAKKKKI